MGKALGWFEIVYLILGILPFATYIGVVTAGSGMDLFFKIWLIGLIVLMLIQGLVNVLGDNVI
ncbi:hypothetical protein HYT58_02960 [Candidatus Woesearchaeota archaeon]|nr:hypothetical protein [Candidatus Woesearchaeota archaeon]